MEKTIFISAFSNFVIRNILSTDFLKFLSRSDFRIVILAPSRERDYLSKNFGSDRILIEGIEIPKLTRGKILIGFLSRSLLNTNTVNLFLKLRLDFKKPLDILQYFLSKIIGFMFEGSKIARLILRKFDYSLLGENRFEAYFDKYKPTLVLSTDITDRSEGESDIDLIRESKKRGVFVIGMVRSWDNLAGRGIIREIPDRIVVQNEIIKKECEEYNNIPGNKIEIIGIPHYDNYLKTPIIPREVFFDRMKLNSKKKTILFVTIADDFLKKQFSKNNISYNSHILNILKRLDKNTTQIIIRMPIIGIVKINDINISENFKIDSPGKLFNKGELSVDADKHLADLIYHSDVILPGPSTIIVDALFFNKPIVFAGFDNIKAKSEDDSIRKFFKLEHLIPIVKSSGVKISYSENDLICDLNRYIVDPKLNFEARKKLADMVCWKRDGKSAERLAQFVLNFCV